MFGSVEEGDGTVCVVGARIRGLRDVFERDEGELQFALPSRVLDQATTPSLAGDLATTITCAQAGRSSSSAASRADANLRG